MYQMVINAFGDIDPFTRKKFPNPAGPPQEFVVKRTDVALSRLN